MLPVFQQNQLVLEAAIGEDHVLFDPETGLYCHLNDVGKDIWDFFSAPGTLQEAAENLSRKYAADPSTCQKDSLPFLEILTSNAFIVPGITTL